MNFLEVGQCRPAFDEADPAILPILVLRKSADRLRMPLYVVGGTCPFRFHLRSLHSFKVAARGIRSGRPAPGHNWRTRQVAKARAFFRAEITPSGSAYSCEGRTAARPEFCSFSRRYSLDASSSAARFLKLFSTRSSMSARRDHVSALSSNRLRSLPADEVEACCKSEAARSRQPIAVLCKSFAGTVIGSGPFWS